MKDYYTETRQKMIREWQIDYLIDLILEKRHVPQKLLKNLGVKTYNV